MKEFDNKPKTIDDIGKDTFISLPFYKRNKEHKVIYINPSLYEEIFEKEYDYETAIKDIKERFSVTLDEALGKEKLGDAYVDKQGDPTDIALNGNKGSGRAFYLYENCNIKGEKTPLATSFRDDYNNGKYSLDCAIQETLISNVLNSEDEFSNFETLAIIDLEEKYLFPHTSGELPCGLIIRYSKDKELYRFSHRFVNNKPFTKEELIKVASKIGELEGNKFIKRFLHGAWSIGNLSIDANMIDLDTSFYVTGRHPQWSFTDRFITNYFGYESKGQMMVLDTILDSELNIDKVSKEEIQSILDEERIKIIREGFVKLIGYEKEIYNKYQEQFDYLIDEFMYLSKVMYDNYDNLSVVDKNCQNTNIFDFSNLFRYYEIYKQSEKWNKINGLNLLLNGKSKYVEYKYDNEEYHNKILSFFDDIIIKDEAMYFSVLTRAIKFIESFDKLNELIDSKETIDKDKKLIRAYMENENKTYLTGRKWIRGELIDLYETKGEEVVNYIMNGIIEVYSKKDYGNRALYTDLTIFDEGIFFRYLDNGRFSGYNRLVVQTYEPLNDKELYLNINGKEIILEKKDDTTYLSLAMSNKDLEKIEELIIKYRDNTFEFNEIGRDVKIERMEKVIEKVKKYIGK